VLVVVFFEVKMIENMSLMYLKTAQVPDPIKRQPKIRWNFQAIVSEEQ